MTDPKLPEGTRVEVRYNVVTDQTGRVERYDTFALLFSGDEPVAAGRTHLAPGDQAVRKTGRHKAIGRAVQAYTKPDKGSSILIEVDGSMWNIPEIGRNV